MAKLVMLFRRYSHARLRLPFSRFLTVPELDMDRIDKEHRSWNMSRIRGTDTRPELLVRSLLHRLGYRFRLTSRNVPGKPDIVLAKYRTAIFVHGCFWHRHQGCGYAYRPKSNTAFWDEKFARNVVRDTEVSALVDAAGWKQLIIWECELRNLEKLEDRIREFFKGLSSNEPAKRPLKRSSRRPDRGTPKD